MSYLSNRFSIKDPPDADCPTYVLQMGGFSGSDTLDLVLDTLVREFLIKISHRLEVSFGSYKRPRYLRGCLPVVVCMTYRAVHRARAPGPQYEDMLIVADLC